MKLAVLLCKRCWVWEHQGLLEQGWDSLSVLQHPKPHRKLKGLFFLLLLFFPTTSWALESQPVTIINLIINVLGFGRIHGFQQLRLLL